MINGLTLLLAGSAVIHTGFIAWCLRVWMRQPVTGPARMQEEFLPQVSIVIPVRNEAATIVRTVESVALQQYPADRFELIIVDDGSSDRTAETAQSAFDRFPALRSSILSLKDQGSKKAAIEAGVRAASGDWILATDGDTYFGPLWMKSMMRAALSPGVKLVCGPVITVPKDRLSLVGRTAAAESIGLTVIAGAGILSGHPFFCNGANMAYQKAHFAALKGFDSASGRLSGDDTELLIRTPATEVRYVGTPSAAVRTEAPESLLEFVSQRQRWASKIPVSLSGTTFFFALCAWLCHALLIVSLTGCFGWELPVVAWSVKSFVESALLKVSGRSFTEPVSLPLILILQPFYALAVLLVGVTAVVMPYRWKGRKGH